MKKITQKYDKFYNKTKETKRYNAIRTSDSVHFRTYKITYNVDRERYKTF